VDFGIIVLGVLINSLLSLSGAYIASEKGRSGAAFWFLGFLLSFLIALLVAIGVPKVEHEQLTAAHKKCHACKEKILREALLCRFCGSKQEVEEEATEVRSWCPNCRSEFVIAPNSDCPTCGKATHPWG
jgi:hypothetical protein